MSLEDFPGGGGGVGGVEQNWKYSSAQLGLELGKNGGRLRSVSEVRMRSLTEINERGP